MRLVEEINRIKSMIVILCENDGGDWWKEGWANQWLKKNADIDNTIMVDPNEIHIGDNTMSRYEEKYNNYISGKNEKYFQVGDTIDDLNRIDFEKLPPVILMKSKNGGYDVFDGRHRVFLAKKFNKPIKSIVLK